MNIVALCLSILALFLGTLAVYRSNTLVELAMENERLKVQQRDKFIETQVETMNAIESENEELKTIRINAERRATEYARKIKAIEDVMTGEGTIIDKNDKINELLFPKKQ